MHFWCVVWVQQMGEPGLGMERLPGIVHMQQHGQGRGADPKVWRGGLLLPAERNHARSRGTLQLPPVADALLVPHE